MSTTESDFIIDGVRWLTVERYAADNGVSVSTTRRRMAQGIVTTRRIMGRVLLRGPDLRGGAIPIRH